MKNNKRIILKNMLITLISIAGSTLLSELFYRLFGTNAIAPMIFILSVFIIALKTDGIFWGILASFICVLLDICMFGHPNLYFSAVSWPEDLTTVTIMLVVAIITSLLTSKLKYHEKRSAEIEKEKMRADLLRAISHDIRTPLSSIHSASSMLLSDFDTQGREKNLQLISEINSDAKWLIRMSENLLSVTRINGKDIKINTSLTVLEELTDAAITKFKARHPDIHTEVNIPSNIIAVSADPLLIEQVILNILENAVIHAKGMKHLYLTAEERESTVFFEIRDDGCGIPKEILENLFYSHIAQSDIATDARKKNTGLGLSICATIIRAHGGSIHAKNIKTGGAAFSFTLKKESIENEQQ